MMPRTYLDAPLAAALADADRIRQMTEVVPAAVRQMQRDFAERQAMVRQIEQIYGFIDSAAFRQLQQDLEMRRELCRRMALASAAGIDSLRTNFDSVCGVLYRHRGVMDILMGFPSLAGGGPGGGVSPPTRKLRKSYQHLSQSLESGEVSPLPEELKGLLIAEAFTSSEVAEEREFQTRCETDAKALEIRERRREIRRHLGEEGRALLGPALIEVDPAFEQLWLGALLALKSGNPERGRHFSTSCRELLDSLLDRLAPLDRVKRWSTTPVKVEKGKASRKDQLRYLRRELQEDPELAEFAESASDEICADFFQYNKGVHALASLTPEELDALETRTVRHLLFVLYFRERPS
jgi:hypothetical protein